MYSARFDKDNGDVFYFDWDHKILIDIDPLSEIEVDISTSQGFAQVGTTIENQSVDGLERLITGRIIGDANAKKEQLLHTFTPFSKGRLYFNDKYYVDCVVKTTPAFGIPKKDVPYTLAIYCSSPYWLGAEQENVYMNTYTPCFRFPGPTSAIGTNYDSHCFGTKNESAFVNIYNSGDVDATFDVIFSTDASTVTNYGIVNVYTLEYMTIKDTLEYGETTRVYRDGSELKVEKTLADGTVENIFALLDEDSNLFYLHPGDNVFRAYADDEMQPVAIISYNETYVGVYDGM